MVKKDRTLKVLHFLTSIDTGGAEKFCVDLCNTQADISENNIYLCVLDMMREDQPLVKMISSKVNLISLNKRGGYSLKVIFKVYQLLSKIKPDVIHLNGRALIYAFIPILLKRIPSVYTVHTLANKEYNKYIKSLVRLLFNKFPKYFLPVSISNSVSETVKDIYGNQLNTVIFNGSSELTISPKVDEVSLEISTLKKDDDTLVFLFIGRISKEKNTFLLIQAFNELLKEGTNVCLCIVGYDGSKDQAYLLKCQNENKYPDQIKFFGRKENIADYLSNVDAFCLTSNYEGLGIVVLEAFSIGVPVLSTPSGGPLDIIVPGVNGYVSNNISVKSYIEVLSNFIEKPLRNREKIINIYKEKYTMEICALQYLKQYREKINETII